MDVLTLEKLPSRLFFILNCAPRALFSDSRLSIKLKLPLELEVCRVYRTSKTKRLIINLQLHFIYFSSVPFEIFVAISIIPKLSFFQGKTTEKC